jgi:hypothetical protein
MRFRGPQTLIVTLRKYQRRSDNPQLLLQRMPVEM